MIREIKIEGTWYREGDVIPMMVHPKFFKWKMPWKVWIPYEVFFILMDGSAFLYNTMNEDMIYLDKLEVKQISIEDEDEVIAEGA